jgi:hypothetical protein
MPLSIAPCSVIIIVGCTRAKTDSGVRCAHKLGQLGVPLLHRRFVAAQSVDNLLWRFGPVDVHQGVLRILCAKTLRLLGRHVLRLLRHRHGILCLRGRRHRSRLRHHRFLRRHARSNRTAHLPKQRSLVNVHQMIPAL